MHYSSDSEPLDSESSGSEFSNIPEGELSLALLQTLWEGGAAGFVLFDGDLRYLRLNPKMVEINGRPVEAHLGRTAAEALGPEQWALRREGLEKALAGEPTLNLPLPGIYDAEGRPRQILVSYLPLRTGTQGDEDAGVAGVAAVFWDATAETQAAQAQAEQRRLRSEARQATVLEVALDCIIAADSSGRILEFNPAAEKTFGYARAEVLGQLLSETIIPPSLSPAHTQGLTNFLATGEGPVLGQRIEVAAMHRSGREFPIELAIIPIREEGDVIFIAYLRDISARRQDEAEREHLLWELEAGAERQRAFLRDVLASVTEGKLRLCYQADDLPLPRTPVAAPVLLSPSDGLRTLRRSAEAAARTEGFSDDRVFDLLTAAGEAAMNAIVHAGGGTASVSAGDNIVQVRVDDHGKGIDVAHLPRATLEKGYTTAGTLGHGMKMMLQTADRIFLLTGETGTTLVLEQDRLAPARMW